MKKRMTDSSIKDLILIVDDNPTNLGLMSEYLGRNKYDVLLSQSGEDALKKAEQQQPDIILLDVMMPGLDGFETCTHLKANPATSHIPVIFVTALQNTMDKIRGFEAGGIDYITKPFQPEEIGVRVSTHLTILKLQRQLQEQNALLHQQKEELFQLNANKDRFFSIIAHDLRTPLTSFLTYTRFATEHFEGFQPHEIQTILNDLCDTSENLYRLLENLLEWAQIQRGMIEYHLQEIDIYDALLRNIDLLKTSAQQKEITVHTDLRNSLWAYFDKHIVDLVIRNILSNAIKFTPQHGQVTITATPHKTKVRLAVTDTGTGLSQDECANLFHIGQKVRHPGTAGEVGTGLGLVLCKELLEANGGQITVESELGKGSTFIVTLPGPLHETEKEMETF
jgi:signal transduction histidine kinase